MGDSSVIFSKVQDDKSASRLFWIRTLARLGESPSGQPSNSSFTYRRV